MRYTWTGNWQVHDVRDEWELWCRSRSLRCWRDGWWIIENLSLGCIVHVSSPSGGMVKQASKPVTVPKLQMGVISRIRWWQPSWSNASVSSLVCPSMQWWQSDGLSKCVHLCHYCFWEELEFWCVLSCCPFIALEHGHTTPETWREHASIVWSSVGVLSNFFGLWEWILPWSTRHFHLYHCLISPATVSQLLPQLVFLSEIIYTSITTSQLDPIELRGDWASK